jgi:hypothetical protein
MAGQRQSTQRQPQRSGGRLGPPPQEGAPGAGSATDGQEKPDGGQTATQEQVRQPPALPTERRSTAETLESKTVLLYGPAGIGKSTLASEWAGGDMFFFDTAGELGDLEVYSKPIPSWESFRSYCWSLAEDRGKFKGAVIDTADVLGMLASQSMRKKLGIVHESDAEWGKGWTLVKEMFAVSLAKLAALPDFGVVLVSHSRETEIKTRAQSYIRFQPTLTGGVRDTCINMADLVLHVDWSDEDQRVFHTKPSPYWEAKERGKQPRLPAEIPWPVGESGYSVLKQVWEKGAK